MGTDAGTQRLRDLARLRRIRDVMDREQARPLDVDRSAELGGADVVQEPIEQPYGIRDCAVRDPAGNLVRINQRT